MSFTELPVPRLETERLVLRSWQEQDFECLKTIFCDEETARYVGGARSEHMVWRQMATIIGHWHMRGFTVFAVERKEDGKTIGYAGPWYPLEWPEPEIGYALIPEAQGKGYALEAVQAALGYVYDELGWETAISVIVRENEGSRALANRLGAHYVGDINLPERPPAEIWRHLSPAKFRKRLNSGELLDEV
ncbi:GNAT family N-acetyltransferase [Pseudovibrio denitrificans]|uniref:GNAT family N-acetyltransferase n=1 Tax=Pseudovibrio denitrificans TaxID=258256 RepID=UPI0039BF42C0